MNDADRAELFCFQNRWGQRRGIIPVCRSRRIFHNGGWFGKAVLNGNDVKSGFIKPIKEAYNAPGNLTVWSYMNYWIFVVWDLGVHPRRPRQAGWVKWDGHRIIYTISEIPLKNYTNNISGTMSKGYTITNTMKGKASISVIRQRYFKWYWSRSYSGSWCFIIFFLKFLYY